MYFITNRFPRQSPRTRRGRSFNFDTANNLASQSVYFCEAGENGNHTEIGSVPMFERLSNVDYRQILLFVHGFNVPPDRALKTGLRLQALCDASRPKEALVVPLIWPTDNDPGLLKDYKDDQQAADMSGFAYSRVFAKFAMWQGQSGGCLKRINTLSHSMGTRVLRQALYRWNKDELRGGVPLIFRNNFLVASDVVNTTLEENEFGRLICDSARNVVVYHAADDLALRASKLINMNAGVKTRRLGHSGPAHIGRIPTNVFSLDCDDFSLRYDPNTGHNYYLEDPDTGSAGRVFNHLFATLADGRVVAEAEGFRAGILRG